MLQAALLADASDECMILIRFFDQREVDNAKICAEVKRFIEAIALLFFEERIWVVEGHTKVCLDFLQKQTLLDTWTAAERIYMPAPCHVSISFMETSFVGLAANIQTATVTGQEILIPLCNQRQGILIMTIQCLTIPEPSGFATKVSLWKVIL